MTCPKSYFHPFTRSISQLWAGRSATEGHPPASPALPTSQITKQGTRECLRHKVVRQATGEQSGHWTGRRPRSVTLGDNCPPCTQVSLAR